MDHGRIGDRSSFVGELTAAQRKGIAAAQPDREFAAGVPRDRGQGVGRLAHAVRFHGARRPAIAGGVS